MSQKRTRESPSPDEASATASTLMRAHLTKLYMGNDPDFPADFTIRCNGDVFYTHKIIISQNNFFAGLYKPGFKEGFENEAVLPEDNPKLVHVLIRHLYGQEMNIDGNIFEFIDLYATCAKYHFPDLKQFAMDRVRYLLPGALQGQNAGPPSWDFLHVAAHIFESTPESDRGLRAVLINFVDINASRLFFLRWNHQNANYEAGLKILRKSPQLAAELAMCLLGAKG